MPKNITDKEFDQEVIKSGTPVLVDFWAEWCPPCKQLIPVLDELDKELGDQVKIAKVNIEESPEAPSKYAVRSIPTLILFKNGEVVDSKVGAYPKESLLSWIKENI